MEVLLAVSPAPSWIAHPGPHPGRLSPLSGETPKATSGALLDVEANRRPISRPGSERAGDPPRQIAWREVDRRTPLGLGGVLVCP